MIEDVIDRLIETYCSEKFYEDWNIEELNNSIYGIFGIKLDSLKDIKDLDTLREKILYRLKEFYEKKEQEIGKELMRMLEKMITLQVVDNQWKDHLLAMDHLKEGIGLRGYAQRDPLVEYKREAFEMFAEMTERIKTEVLTRLYKIQVRSEQEAERISRKKHTKLLYNRTDGGERRPIKRTKKIGRNEPCPCGSGKKYKKCCGMNV